MAIKKTVGRGGHLEIYESLREEMGMKTYSYYPMDYAKTLKVQFCVGDLDLPERSKRYTSSREEEEDIRTDVPL